MPSCFLMFVLVFQATRGVKNDLDQNLSFFTDIYKVNGALNGRAGCNPQPSIFCRFQCIFLTNLEKNTSGTSLPEGFSPLVHFGPPQCVVFTPMEISFIRNSNSYSIFCLLCINKLMPLKIIQAYFNTSQKQKVTCVKYIVKEI